jgi:tRNA threonylcarbamoyladenosine biosynthesis protein TsaE
MSAIELKTAEETAIFAAKLAGICEIGDCILLYGDVGVGKTTFARGFIKALTGTLDEIVSPTFTLVQTYPLPTGGAVWHCDLYRLKYPQELVELGLEEGFMNGITLVEWPEVGEPLLPDDALKIKLEINGEGRIITLESEHWKKRLKKL